MRDILDIVKPGYMLRLFTHDSSRKSRYIHILEITNNDLVIVHEYSHIQQRTIYDALALSFFETNRDFIVEEND